MKQFIVQLLVASVVSQTVEDIQGGGMGMIQGGSSYSEYSEFSSGDGSFSLSGGSFSTGGEGMSANMTSGHMAAGHASGGPVSMATTTTGGGIRKL
jgi:hypothetical protein